MRLSQRTLVLARLGVGSTFALAPRVTARLLGRVQPTTGDVTIVRLLGARDLAQGVLQRDAGVTGLLAGTGVDLLHVTSALVYARSPRGHTPGRRSTMVAGAFVLAQLATALALHRADTKPTVTPLPTRPPQPEPVAWVGSARSAVWPSPAEAQAEARVLVGEPAERTVQLCGGVMDGALIVVAPGQRSYTVKDSDNGPVTYEQATETGRPDGDVFVLVEPPRQ